MISIIVPVYNTELYLQKCIESVVSQHFHDWELVLVDDGSTDNSGKICDEYAAKDSRIRVKHKPNSGVSDTRNTGLSMAKGDWIFFLDSDDELYPFSLDLLSQWSKGCDMVVGIYDMKVTNPNYKCGNNNPTSLYSKVVNPKKFVRLLMHTSLGFAPTVFPKLYRLKIINDNNLRFNEKIYYAEDQLFLAQYLCCNETQRVYVNNTKSVYRYNLRTDNATSVMVERKLTVKTFTDFVGFYSIYETYKGRFKDRKIISWAKWNAYVSGMNIKSMMTAPHAITTEQPAYLTNRLGILTNNGKDKKLINKYDYNEKFLAMKRKVRELSKEEKICTINNWLRSEDCAFTYLTKGWKIIYLLSHCLGTFGVRLFINKIKFN
jgi:glycosyltransferase involved in cell wall biosynthesis